MASWQQARAWRAKGLCKDCGRKPAKDRVRCQPCLDRQSVYNKRAYDKRKAAKGGNVEPQCQPSKGPMRAEHEWDAEGELCVNCGKPRPAGFVPSAAPADPQPAPVPQRRAADQVKRSAGPRGTVTIPSREQRLRFHGQMTAPVPGRPVPVREVEPVAVVHGAEPADDVATIPDPIAATIAELDLWRSEIDNAISTLQRLQARKSA